MPIDPINDPNEAYEAVSMNQEFHGPPPGWWTATCNGVPLHHFSPASRAAADRYVTDPAYRLSRETRFVQDKGRR